MSENPVEIAYSIPPEGWRLALNLVAACENLLDSFEKQVDGFLLVSFKDPEKASELARDLELHIDTLRSGWNHVLWSRCPLSYRGDFLVTLQEFVEHGKRNPRLLSRRIKIERDLIAHLRTEIEKDMKEYHDKEQMKLLTEVMSELSNISPFEG